jgi:aspartate 1-decarboxylase
LKEAYLTSKERNKMLITTLYSKIHRATVTDANLDYVGSITIDSKLLKEAKMFVGQKVDIVNINNGERFSTYIIKGEEGSGEVCLNGAAARKVQKGDKIIIIAYISLDINKVKEFKPKIVIVDDQNRVAQAFEGLD